MATRFAPAARHIGEIAAAVWRQVHRFVPVQHTNIGAPPRLIIQSGHGHRFGALPCRDALFTQPIGLVQTLG